jgi:hypothetical protein
MMLIENQRTILQAFSRALGLDANLLTGFFDKIS